MEDWESIFDRLIGGSSVSSNVRVPSRGRNTVSMRALDYDNSPKGEELTPPNQSEGVERQCPMVLTKLGHRNSFWTGGGGGGHVYLGISRVQRGRVESG